MRRAAAVLFVSIAIGCSSGSTLPPPGGGGPEAGADAATAADAAQDSAVVDAGCLPISKHIFDCAVDSDCPLPQPPQNLESYCCGVISRAAGSCETLSLSETTCTHGGCGGAPLTCSATTGSVGPQHLCGRASDCAAAGQHCCTVCQGGLSFALCMSSTDATELGAQCL